MAASSRIASGAWLCAAATLTIAILTAGCGTASPAAPVVATSATASVPPAPSADGTQAAPSATATASVTPMTLSMVGAPRTVEPCLDQAPTPMDPNRGPDATIPEPAPLQRMEAFATDFPQGLAVAAGSIWTANEFLDTVTRIDATTGEVTTIRVAPGLGPQRVAETTESIWASGAGGLIRIDPENNAVDPRVSGCVISIASAFGSLWAGDAGGVLRVDPATGLAVDEIRPAAAAGILCHVSVTDDSVWLGCDPDLYRIDPTTNAVSATVSNAGANPSVIAADGVAWVMAGMDPFSVSAPEDAFTTLERLDLATNRLIPDTKMRLVHGASAAGHVIDGHVIWLSTTFGVGPGAGTLLAFEPASGNVVAAFDISEGNGYGSNAIDFAYGSLWTASGTANAVRRFPRPTP